MKTIKPIGVSENRNDAKSARQEMLQSGIHHSLWKYPRDLRRPFEAVFDTPEELWEAAVEYFEWAENAALEYHVELGRNTGQMVKIKKPRPFHIRAFFAFCGITKKMWDRMNNLPEFDLVIGNIEDIIYMQKFDNGMVGVFDAGMTSKDLGLTDKREVTAEVNASVNNVSPRDVLLARLQKGDTADAG